MSEGVYEIAVGIDDAYGKSFGAFADGEITKGELESIATSTMTAAGVAACAALTAGIGTLACAAVVPVIARFIGRYIAEGVAAIVGNSDYCSDHRDAPECSASNEDRLSWQSIRLALSRAMDDAIDTLVSASGGAYTRQSARYELAGGSIYWSGDGSTPEQIERVGLGGQYRSAPTVAHMRERLAAWDAAYRAALADLAASLTRALATEQARPRADARIDLADALPPRLRSAPPPRPPTPLPPATSPAGASAAPLWPLIGAAGVGAAWFVLRAR